MGLIGDVSPRRLYPDIPDPKGECPAVEVMRFRHPQGYYAMSHVPRGNRFVDQYVAVVDYFINYIIILIKYK